jgi:hypothetical protein
MSRPASTDASFGRCALWREVLPTGDHVSVDLLPHRESVSVVARVNGDVWRYRWCHDLAQAERLAWQWWDDMPNLMGLGLDDSVDMLTFWT